MARSPRKTSTRKTSADGAESKVSEPQASYLPKSTKRAKATSRRQKGYDAQRYTGLIPGIAERMKEYLKHMRDDR